MGIFCNAWSYSGRLKPCSALICAAFSASILQNSSWLGQLLIGGYDLKNCQLAGCDKNSLVQFVISPAGSCHLPLGLGIFFIQQFLR